MKALHSIRLALSTFSRLPVGKPAWDKDGMAYVLCAFPLIGIVLGAAAALWMLACAALNLGAIAFAAGVVVLNLLITGGIHLDGFADVSDALASCAPPEEKRKIMKDPRAGAFAVIGVSGYLIAFFAALTLWPLNEKGAATLALIFVLSRVFSGTISLALPSSASEGLLHTFREGANQRALAILLSELVPCAALFVFLCGWAGTGALAAALLCAAGVRRMSVRQFGGMSGDLSGYFLCIGELAMIAAVVIINKAVSL